jgi:hypothetical protein
MLEFGPAMRTLLPRAMRMILGAGLVLGLLVGLFGCARKPPAPKVPVSNPGRPAAPNDKGASETAKQATTDYLQALTKGDTARAYDLLSEASRQGHSREDFEAAAKKARAGYALERAWTEKAGADRAEVIVPFLEGEEPGGKAFSLVKEKGQWKIIYLVGTPFSPYEK